MTETSMRTVHRRGQARRSAAIAAVVAIAIAIATLSMAALPGASASVRSRGQSPCELNLLEASDIEAALSVPVDPEPTGSGSICSWTIPAVDGVPERDVDLIISNAAASQVQKALSEGLDPVQDEENAFIGLSTTSGTSTPNIVRFVGATKNLGGVVTVQVSYEFSAAKSAAGLPADDAAVVTLGLQARDRYKAASPFAKAPKGSKVLLEELLAQPSDAFQPFSDKGGTAAFEDEGLTVTAADPSSPVFVIPEFQANGPKLATNVRIEVETTGMFNAAAGLVCRYGAHQAYAFAVGTERTDSGLNTRFGAIKNDGSARVKTLTAGSVPDDLYPEPDLSHERNRLVVDCRGSKKPSDGDQFTASFTINGKVHKVVDKKSPLANGGVGLLVETVNPDLPSDGYAKFTNLRVTQLPK
jgi:hypothetical protein